MLLENLPQYSHGVLFTDWATAFGSGTQYTLLPPAVFTADCLQDFGMRFCAFGTAGLALGFGFGSGVGVGRLSVRGVGSACPLAVVAGICFACGAVGVDAGGAIACMGLILLGQLEVILAAVWAMCTHAMSSDHRDTRTDLAAGHRTSSGTNTWLSTPS